MTIIKIRKDYVSDKAVLILSDGYVSFPVELSMSGYTYKHIIRKYISIIELEKPAWHFKDQSYRWIEIWSASSDWYNNHYGITATKEMANELGYTNLEKLSLWPKNTKDNRFVEWRPMKEVWVYTNEDRSKAVLAELNENDEAVESSEKEHHKVPRKKNKKGVWRMTVIEDDLVMEC